MGIFRKSKLPPILLALIGLFAFTACDRSELGEEAARERLRKAFTEASNNRDIPAMLDLFCWDNVEDRYRSMIEVAVQNEIHYPLKKITFHPIKPDDSIDFDFRGTPYVANLEPRLRMGVEYTTEDFFTVSYLLGFQDGAYKLINAAPKSVVRPTVSAQIPENPVEITPEPPSQ